MENIAQGLESTGKGAGRYHHAGKGQSFLALYRRGPVSVFMKP